VLHARGLAHLLSAGVVFVDLKAQTEIFDKDLQLNVTEFILNLYLRVATPACGRYRNGI
jgi:hypothetical protein